LTLKVLFSVSLQTFSAKAAMTFAGVGSPAPLPPSRRPLRRADRKTDPAERGRRATPLAIPFICDSGWSTCVVSTPGAGGGDRLIGP
jgi:hypothetical protein